MEIGTEPSGVKHRDVACWSDGNTTRVLLDNRYRLYAIHAATGEPDTGFGEGGNVVLTERHGRPVTRYELDQTAVPVVFEDLVIVRSRWSYGVERMFDPPGTVQAFDVRAGEQCRGCFFAVPQASAAYARQRVRVRRAVSGGYRGTRTWPPLRYRAMGARNKRRPPHCISKPLPWPEGAD